MSLKPRMLQKPVPSLWGCCKWCGDNLVLAIKAREGITPRLAGGAILLGLLLLVLQWFGVRVPFSAENAVSALSSGLLVWGSFYVFIWAPYKGIQELTYRNRLLVEKRFKIECGEMTTKRDCSIALFESDANTGIILRRYRVGIAFFGFRLINLGATTATNCRATLVGIEKDSVSICSDCGERVPKTGPGGMLVRSVV